MQRRAKVRKKTEQVELSSIGYIFLPIHFYKDKFLFMFLLVSLIQGSGWNLITGATGLDISAIWLIGESIRDGRMSQAGYITVYGPLGFLDWTFISDGSLLLFSILFRIFCATLTFSAVFQLLNFTKLGANQKGLATSLFSTFVCTSLSPASAAAMSLVIISIIVMHKNVKIGNRTFLGMSILLSILFLIKLLYFLFGFLAIFFIIFSSKRLSRQKRLIEMLKIASTSILAILLFGILLGFSISNFVKWVYGYLEMSSGYGAMYAEEVGRLWEYPAFFILVILTLSSMRMEKLEVKDFVYMILIFFFIFRYGFTRHDGHSIFTFTVILIIALSFLTLVNRGLNWITTICTITVYVIVSNFSLLNFADVTSRINALGAHVKLIDSRYFNQKLSESDVKLTEAQSLPTEFITQVGSSTVSFFPWPITMTESYQFKLSYPPQPQLFAAYTNWLDTQNREWINSDRASEYLIEAIPGTIDGRNPIWDSPSFQIEKFCNYMEVNQTDKWILLERLSEPRCLYTSATFIGESRGEFTVSADPDEIVFAEILTSQDILSVISNTLFKSTANPQVGIDGQKYRFVTKNSAGNILAVGAAYDRVGKWRMGDSHTIQLQENMSARLFSIKPETKNP